MKKKALLVAHVASMLDLFNRDNIKILQELGYEVHICCNFSSGNVTSKEKIKEFKYEMEQAYVVCHQVPFPRKLSAVEDMVSSYLILNSLMKKEGFTLIHCQAPISGVITRLVARRYRRSGVKVIYAAHGFHFFKGAPLKNWLLYYPVERIISAFTDCIITINKEDYERAKKFYSKDNNRVIYIPGVGVHFERYHHAKTSEKNYLKSSLKIPVEAKLIVTVGELNKGKNHTTALKAFAMANPKDAYYLICGIGKYERELRSLVRKLQIDDRVRFLGYRSDISRINSCADIFLFPSVREGLPVSVMEAMASGLPVICSDIRGNRDLIVDTKGGYMFDKYDIAGFQNAIMNLLQDDDLRQRMGAYNRQAVKRYDSIVVNEMMRKLYLNME